MENQKFLRTEAQTVSQSGKKTIFEWKLNSSRANLKNSNFFEEKPKKFIEGKLKKILRRKNRKIL